MKNSFAFGNSLALCALAILFSCNNENELINPNPTSQDSFANHVDDQTLKTNAPVTPFTFAACDRFITTLDPPAASRFTLAALVNGQYRKFHLGADYVVVFTKPDIINFEFSGKYFDKGNKIKLYRIRRSDGLYLTRENRKFHVNYQPKSSAPRIEPVQLWILNNLGNSKIQLLLPMVPEHCQIARYGYDGDKDRFVAETSSQFNPGTTLLMQTYSVGSIPPNPN